MSKIQIAQFQYFFYKKDVTMVTRIPAFIDINDVALWIY